MDPERVGPRAAVLATTNFDPLLEQAMALQARLRGRARDWEQFRRPTGSQAFAREPDDHAVVQHIHGWVDPGGSSGGQVVLAESEYLELLDAQDAEPNIQFGRLFDQEKSTLIIGMSLTDPNLRRFLHRRRRRRYSRGEKVYAVLRRSGDMLDVNLSNYWSNWGVDTIFLDDYVDLPQLIRDIQWGLSPGPPWFSEAAGWVSQELGGRGPFEDDWQRGAHDTLRIAADYIRIYYAVPAEECLQISLFLPMSDVATEHGARIFKVATTRRLRSGAEARAHAIEKSLRVDTAAAEGVAGLAYYLSRAFEVLDNGSGINANFDAAKRERWDRTDGYRDWRSIMAIAILDGQHWLPVGVVTISSNHARPFWVRFEDRVDLSNLKAHLRRLGKYLISEFPSSGIPPGAGPSVQTRAPSRPDE